LSSLYDLSDVIGLLKWVFAMVNYNSVAKTVEPKRKKVADSERNLRMAQKDLAKTKAEVQSLNEQLKAGCLPPLRHRQWAPL